MLKKPSAASSRRCKRGSRLNRRWLFSSAPPAIGSGSSPQTPLATESQCRSEGQDDGGVMLYLNYEIAQSLLYEGEPLVVIVGTQLHHEVISDESRELRPRWPFDMAYFYASMCSTVAAMLEHPIASFALTPRMVAAGVPDLRTQHWSGCDFCALGLAARYVAMVQSDSVPGGDPFDLQFALEIACRALSRTFLASLKEKVENFNSNAPSDPWDDWLDGCSTTPKSP